MPESAPSPTTAPRYSLVVFDWDGTLYDSTGIIVRCIQAAVRDVGGTVPDDRAAAYVIGMSLNQALAHAAPDVPPERYPQLGERYKHHYRKHHDDLSLFDGVLPMLDALRKRGHLLAVATGKSRRGLDEALDSVELRGVFDGSRTADETAGKPDPLMLKELSADLDVPQDRILMIGDTTHDLLMARNAGCASIGVSYGAHTPEAFGELGPLHVAHSVADLAAWLAVNG
ncbi:HAD-IA family hydrolase [Xylophilus rhododendri]|uniref:HAD-IA family hydrolase n=1 Tax=Xylophilus rhododendri TaxID=2697032 RepID=A0A857J499_9BURK|nr:HAD-IA family hydrolase [Xylophilus rhododendri]QHI98053.1 HAD-IA family hydrolase [Xylophilus rhododendri]